MEWRKGVTEELLVRETQLEVERSDGDMKSWNKRQTASQTEGGMEDSWKATESGGWWGCTWWMIVLFAQASSVANGEIAQIPSFHLLCF